MLVRGTLLRTAVPWLLAACLVVTVPASTRAQTSWGIAATINDELVFCDARRDTVWKLDASGHLSILLAETHCRNVALGYDGFVYGESVSAGTHVDASTGVSRDSSFGIWRFGISGKPMWIEAPTPTPDPSIWIAVASDGRSYAWKGALPRSAQSQIVRRERPGLSVPVAGFNWGQRDGVGLNAEFGAVAGLAVAPDNSVIVIDSGNVRRVSPAGAVTTESVGTISATTAALLGETGLWDHTIGVASDATGAAFVVDYPAARIVHVARDGTAREAWRSGGLANWITGRRWGWRPAGVAVLRSGLYVMEDWPLPPLAADVIGSPRIVLVKPDGSYESIVSVSSWWLRSLATLIGLVLLSWYQARRRFRWRTRAS